MWGLRMKDVEAVAASLTFEDLLQAVNESSRGRWFLDEYQKRLRKSETGDIISAINRIEARLEAMPASAAAPAELTRMRQALANARADIAKLAPAKTLSDEGRMFAGLAEMARKALSAEKATADLAPGIVKALQLVDELDATLSGSKDAAAGAKYFKQDEALFEPAPAIPKPVLVAKAPEPPPATAPIAATPTPAATKPATEVPQQGAKLVIIKAGVKVEEAPKVEAPAPTAEQPAVPEAQPPKADEASVAPTTVTPAVEKPALQKPVAEMPAVIQPANDKLPTGKVDNPRIVIIRRKPEEMTEVPLADEAMTGTAA